MNLGADFLFTAILISVYSIIISLTGAKRDNPRLMASARNGTYLVCVMTTLASAVFMIALLTRDFRLEYVASHTSRDLPLPYTIAAFWAGQEGSLLLWTWLLSLFAAIVQFQNRHRQGAFTAYVNMVMMATTSFFLLLLIAVDDPFRTLQVPPLDGLGLNPLLQNPEMVIHPPALLLGYVGFTIPFAFAMAALLTRKLGQEWLQRSRGWTLFSWFALGIGTLLGAQWAYVELGWGGYWAWDPVENASLMPWLVGTAFLHSSVMQEKRGIMKIWNMVLVMLTFLLCIFGTFLTRSGIISSVHAFASSPTLGYLFITFMGLTLAISIFLLVSRLPLLKGSQEPTSFASRENSFLFNTILFLGMAFAVFWGTMYPVLSELGTGQAISLGPSFFNRVITPLGLVLAALIGLCPLLAWKKTPWATMKKQLLVPCCLFIMALGLSALLGVRKPAALLAFALCGFILASVTTEWVRGIAARRTIHKETILTAAGRLARNSKKRYGGYVVHTGMAAIFVGITGSALNMEQEVTLHRGEETTLGRFTLRHEAMEYEESGSIEMNTAVVSVFIAGRQVDVLKPQKNFHRDKEQPVSEAAIRSTLRDDLYLLLLGWEEDDTATFGIHVNPLMLWIWIGGGIFTIGTLMAAWPGKRKAEGEVK